jgi:hypothetical protein
METYRIKVDLEEAKRQLLEANPKDYFNKTELKEIFKTAKNFEFEVNKDGYYFMASDDPDRIVIQITFDWEACPHPEKYGHDQKWYLDFNKYISNERKYKIEKLLKNN